MELTWEIFAKCCLFFDHCLAMLKESWFLPSSPVLEVGEIVPIYIEIKFLNSFHTEVFHAVA